MSTLQNFINDFLQSTTDDDPTQGMGPVAPAAPPPPPPPPRSRRREPGARRSARATAPTRPPPKAPIEVRARTAEAGGGRRENSRSLLGAPARPRSGRGLRTQGETRERGESRDLLQRATSVVRALTAGVRRREERAAAARATRRRRRRRRRRSPCGWWSSPRPRVPGAIGGSGAARRRVAQRVRAARRRRRRGAWRGLPLQPPRRLLWETAGPHYHRARRRPQHLIPAQAPVARGAEPVRCAPFARRAAAGVSLNTAPRGPVAGADADGAAARALWWGRRYFATTARVAYSPIPD